MNKKGFTLIELLAVIVILAIIALIATPIVLDIIADTNKESSRSSVENYFDAIELSIAKHYMANSTEKLDGTYEIIDDGKKIKSKTTEKEYKIDYKGKSPSEGQILIEKGKVKKVSGVKIDIWNVKLKSDGIHLIKNLKTSSIVSHPSGSEFNNKIKQLVVETNQYWNSDTTIKSIEFFSNGMLPTGHTLHSLKELKSVDISNDKDKSIMAYYEEGKVYVYSENLISFPKNSMYMFANFSELEIIKFNEIDTSSVTNMSRMFWNGNKIKQLDLSAFDTSQVTTMTGMFYFCEGLISLDLSSFDTSEVTDMSSMFSECRKIETINLSSFKTSKVEYMSGMFNNCWGLKNINLNNFDTESVTTMRTMFQGCKSLTSLDLSNFDTSNITDMSLLFNYCDNLKEIDLSNFDTNQVTTMYCMFNYTTSLKSVIVSKKTWIIDEDTNINGMFTGSGIKEVTLVE